MKQHYLEQMDRVMDAYSRADTLAFYEETRANGMSDHAFPRVTAAIGILLAHGKRAGFRDIFPRMMDLCTEQMPKTDNGTNDFGIQEMVHCLLELEASGLFPKTETDRWRAAFSGLDPMKLYRVIAPEPPRPVGNWAAYNAAGEQLLRQAGMADHEAFIERQIASQMSAFDENGMYRDPDEPMYYDAGARMQLALLLHGGYRGRYREELEARLKQAGLATLKMQSVNGEMPYGGRSNQFIFNEAALCAVFEYEAARYAGEGNEAQAAEMKRAAALAGEAVDRGLSGRLSHVKNGYPARDNMGCEGYAHFNKYMATAASFLYCAYRFCDDAVPSASSCPAERGGFVWETSPHFHKIFANGFGYSLEYDTCADPHYDCAGLGRIHKKGVPSPLCLSVPVARDPLYRLPFGNTRALSLCGGIRFSDGFRFAADSARPHRLTGQCVNEKEVSFSVRAYPGDQPLDMTYTVTADGVAVTASAPGREAALMMPLFVSDGESESDISARGNSVTVTSQGHTCRYTADSAIVITEERCANRNGLYCFAYATGTDTVRLTIRLS